MSSLAKAVLSVVIYRINGALHLSEQDIPAIIDGANAIWEPAGVQFRIVRIEDIDVVGWPDIQFNNLPVPELGILQGFYGCWSNVPNGVTPRPGHRWFVRDHEERTTSGGMTFAESNGPPLRQ